MRTTNMQGFQTFLILTLTHCSLLSLSSHAHANVIAPQAIIQTTHSNTKAFSSQQQAQQTMQLMARVANWQIANPSPHANTDWTSAALYSGLMRFALIAPQGKYLQHLRQLGENEQWQLGKRKRFFADDQAIAQTWIDLHKIDQRPEQVADTLDVMQAFITRPEAIGNMQHDYKKRTMFERWTWCDALFMAPPVLAKLYADTKDPKWEDALLREYQQTTAFLFDSEENLFFRDHTYLSKKEANGSKVFWSRGNGWVFAGLATILRELPKDAKSRPYFEGLYLKLAKRLAGLQQADGSWHASLLDPESYPVPETSGTGFFTYGFAWGLNSGLLDEVFARPIVEKGWQRLVASINKEGKLGFVQPIGQDPKLVTSDMTENYGVGAFLLAGTEIWQMQLRASQEAHTARVQARVIPERFNDFSFENNQIAGRLYSQELKDTIPATGAIDVWSKNSAKLIIQDWFKHGDYHKDHGQGGDFYSCQGSLGAGGLGYLLKDGQLIPSPAYEKAHVLHQSSDAVVFELNYPEIQVGSAYVREIRRGTLLSNSSQLHFSSRFEVRGDSSDIRVIAGLKQNKQAQSDVLPGILLQWEKADAKAPIDNGYIGLAITAAPNAAIYSSPQHRLIEIGSLKEGARWSSASAWSKANVSNFADWKQKAQSEFLEIQR